MVATRQVTARDRTLCGPALALALVLAWAGVAQASTCRGKQNYKLDIQMQWDNTDGLYRKGESSVGGVLAVSHNKNFKLFEVEQPLRKQIKSLIQENNVGPAKSMLERLVKKNTASGVAGFDFVTGAGPQSTIRMNVLADGDLAGGCTYMTIMGNLLGTPDFFFGTPLPINLCPTGAVNFTTKYPVQGAEANVIAFDAGLDGRDKLNSNAEKASATNDTGKVRIDKRLPPGSEYAKFKLTQGRYENTFAFWKILVIVGVLATALLVAFICLYPVCCKKQMLDVPVPLQDESQWAT